MSDKSSVASPVPAGLVIVSTPIGNLGDLSLRAIETLRGSDAILCEDTRTTAKLLRAHAIETRTEALHEHNEDERIPGLIARLRDGQSLALVSDAGTPLCSDPGYRLVRAVIAADLPLTAIPGANAATTALVLSGLPPHPHLFLGFPPPRQAARSAAFGALRAAERAGLHATLIWYEAPHRLVECLADLHTAFAGRPAVVTRELTKRFEEVRRGDLPALIEYFTQTPPRGEIAVLLGPPAKDSADPEDLDGRIHAALRQGSAKDAAAMVAAATGLPRKLVYARVLALSER